MHADLQMPLLKEAAAARAETKRIRTIRLEQWEELPELETAWSALLARTGSHSVFQTLPWHRCWWKSFGAGNRLMVVLAFSGSRLVGIAPMMAAREGSLRRETVRFIGSANHASDFCDFIVDPEVPGALEALLDNLTGAGHGHAGCKRIDLAHFPGHSPHLARTLQYLKRSGLSAGVDYTSDAPVRVMGDKQADKKASSKTSLRRHTNFFKRSGDLRYVRCATVEEVMAHLDTFFEQHRQRWNQTPTPSQFGDPAQQAFYRDMVRELLPRGWLRFDVVLYNGAPLAFHFGFEYRRCLIYYKSAFDWSYVSKSPGEVLMKFMLESAIADQLEEFDFTVGAESYKYRFANRIRSINRLVAFRSPLEYWAYRGVRRAKDTAKRLLGRKVVAPQLEDNADEAPVASAAPAAATSSPAASARVPSAIAQSAPPMTQSAPPVREARIAKAAQS